MESGPNARATSTGGSLEPYLRMVRSAGVEPQLELVLRDHTRVGILHRQIAKLEAELRGRRAGRSHR